MKKAFAVAVLLGVTTLAAGLSLSAHAKTSGDRCPMRAAFAQASQGSGGDDRCAHCTKPCKPCPSCAFCSPGRSTIL